MAALSAGGAERHDEPKGLLFLAKQTKRLTSLWLNKNKQTKKKLLEGSGCSFMGRGHKVDASGFTCARDLFHTSIWGKGEGHSEGT